MENLQLLQKHKKKTIIWNNIFVFLFIYICIFIFVFTSIYFRDNNENKSLIMKVDRISTIVNDKDISSEYFITNMSDIEKSVFNSALIMYEDGVLINNIVNGDFIYEIPLNKVVRIGTYKYYSRNIIKNNEEYTIIAKSNSSDFLGEIVITFIILLSVAPLIYLILYFIIRSILLKVYNPLEEIIGGLESFAVNINHEFKTSLSEIISSLELAQITKDYEDNNIKGINSAYRLNDILDSLSSMIYFVNSDYRKQKINIIKELDKSLFDIQKLSENKKIIIEKKYNPNASIIKNIDKAPLILCFLNILKNAIKYSHEGGKVEIVINRSSFVIKDYGVGIEEENLDKIFKRFFREKSSIQGKGIGLSIVKKITEIYGWEIDIQSKKDEYTQVAIYF